MTSFKTLLETPECNILNVEKISYAKIKKKYLAAAKQEKPPALIKEQVATAGKLFDKMVFLKMADTKLEGTTPGDDILRNSNRWKCLSTGCLQVDRLLRGGVPSRGITELAGQSGSGKTQLCLQLALTVQLPFSSGGLDSGAVYICTEDKFPSTRLNQMMKCCPAITSFPLIKYGNNIFIEHIADAEELQKCVSERLPNIIRQHPIGLVVVDSVAAVFRSDYSSTEALKRARDLRTFASRLHFLAHTHNIAVVCVNQVTDVKKGEQSYTVPALGLAWANLVNCRLQMFRQHNTRQLHVIFAPHLPLQSCQFNITSNGVVGLD